jgi:hypothetical protein
MKTFKQFIAEDGGGSMGGGGAAGTGDVSTNQIGSAPDTGGVAKFDPLLGKKIVRRPKPVSVGKTKS